MTQASTTDTNRDLSFDPARTVTLSLISHTNVGKTTLARTLLKRDIGEVSDEPHVTDVNEAYEMLRTPGGELLQLWDTPGFGDPVRLLKRLKQSGNPIGWFLEQVWDRHRDRPLWCSQQAIKNVRDDADIVLYLINATELPEEAGYVRIEMQILAYLRKPVLLLLNQTGPAGIQSEEATSWREHLAAHDFIRDILPLDAFTRCWVHEDKLLRAIQHVLDELEKHDPDADADLHIADLAQKRKAFPKIRRHWLEENREIFENSLHALAEEFATAAFDQEPYEGNMWLPHIKKDARDAAMETLGKRLAEEARKCLNKLLRFHRLEGEAAEELLERLAENYQNREPIDTGLAAIVGGAASGAVSGVAADFLAGGLTLGGGAVAGAIVGALGAGTLAKGINVVRGEDKPKVQWSVEFLANLFPAAILRYLAVAHFGRGRGEWQETGDNPEHWHDVVREVARENQEMIRETLKKRSATGYAGFRKRLEKLFRDNTEEVLRRLYGDLPKT